MSFCLAKSVEAELRAIAGNNVCCDCDDKNPQWASVSFGVFMCLECSGRHRALGVHISFVRSVSMDSWTDKQIQQMRLGGNDQFNRFLQQYNVPKTMAILQKYHTPASMLYKDRLSAKVEGRELPTQLPVVATTTSEAPIAEGTDPLPGESEAEYVIRQKKLQDMARERMRAKFGSSSGLNGKMGGVGSDPNYNPNRASSSSDITNLASDAFSFLGSTMNKVTDNVKSGEGWNFLKKGASDLWDKTSNIVNDLTKPEDESGNVFGFSRDHFTSQKSDKGAPLPPSRESSMSRAESAGSSYSSKSNARASPTIRSSTPSPTNTSNSSNEDLKAIAAIKNMNLDNSSVSRNSSSGSLNGKAKQPTALAPSGDDFFAEFGAK